MEVRENPSVRRTSWTKSKTSWCFPSMASRAHSAWDIIGWSTPERVTTLSKCHGRVLNTFHINADWRYHSIFTFKSSPMSVVPNAAVFFWAWKKSCHNSWWKDNLGTGECLIWCSPSIKVDNSCHNSCWTENIARIVDAVQCHNSLSDNKDCHEFRFSIVRIVISFKCHKS